MYLTWSLNKIQIKFIPNHVPQEKISVSLFLLDCYSYAYFILLLSIRYTLLESTKYAYTYIYFLRYKQNRRIHLKIRNFKPKEMFYSPVLINLLSVIRLDNYYQPTDLILQYRKSNNLTIFKPK